MLTEAQRKTLFRKLHKMYGSPLLQECMGKDYETYLRIRFRARDEADHLIMTLRGAIRLLGSSDCEDGHRDELEGMIALMEQLR